MHSAETQDVHEIVRARIAPHFSNLASCRNSAELWGRDLYRTLEPDIRRVLDTAETGDFSRGAAPSRAAYRFVAWNVERGAQFEGQVECLRAHPYLREADVLLLTETDAGMVRSGNRNVARDLAHALGMHYAFIPCYLNLTNGSGIEQDLPGANDLGLHGNAILSRYPLSGVRPVFLANGVDIMASREKRIGRQAALAAQVHFPNLTVTALSVHLDAQSTQRHRYLQLRDVLDHIADAPYVVLGGDWNTSTYNSSRAIHAILGFWLRVLMGVDNVIRNHYLHPYNRFERDLFRLLERRGFEYRASNRLGEHTVAYDVGDLRATKALRDWVPGWCFHFIRWALRNHGGRCPLKLDWFATRGLASVDPRVIHEVREGRRVPLSDHDAIGVDIVAAG
ncbi:MAG TPA: endonuclease/exonuclease/phosphatase family protein [Bryobacteraceae bacterium]|nr:endonuclease/exonuclease/phosphatase family protein [Bryobacteraceae bacterium]